MLERLTEFGNAAVLSLLALFVALWLAHAGSRRAALAWLVGLLACVGTIALLKGYFLACPLPGWALRSPSGHAGFSLFVYGGITLCAARDGAAWRRGLLTLLGSAAVAAIAWSRYALGAHTPIEIVFGLLIGGAALATFAALRGAAGARRFPYLAAALLALAIAATLHLLDWHPSFEGWLREFGRRFATGLPFCTRAS
ncbi:phosphatase PAP2 family protein [Solimonas variicoloris]|uniref:phosphatase PAP2 family protein n=1 Tax=Solimonas variicoloris TaxID=254408 RepID=UPI00036D5928|nr:phosphatase PAP2 family protein [Solimonas variicoloris]